MRRREARLKLSAVRIVAGYVLGLLLTALDAPAAPLTALILYTVLSLIVGRYMYADSPLLTTAERQYVGFISGLAALALGAIMGSAV
jgi:hypothetical protein